MPGLVSAHPGTWPDGVPISWTTPGGGQGNRIRARCRAPGIANKEGVENNIFILSEPPRDSRRLHSLSLREEKADDFTDKILSGKSGAVHVFNEAWNRGSLDMTPLHVVVLAAGQGKRMC